jgi:hypothetical protein
MVKLNAQSGRRRRHRAGSFESRIRSLRRARQWWKGARTLLDIPEKLIYREPLSPRPGSTIPVMLDLNRAAKPVDYLTSCRLACAHQHYLDIVTLSCTSDSGRPWLPALPAILGRSRSKSAMMAGMRSTGDKCITAGPTMPLRSTIRSPCTTPGT